MSENKHQDQVKLSLTESIIGFAVPIGVMIIMILAGVNMIISMLSAVVLLVVFGLVKKYSWTDLDGAMSDGIRSIAGSAVIMLLVGALVGTFMASGTIPTLLYYGFKIIHPAVFLPIAFILSAFVAICTGTSWGAVGTIGVVLMGMSAGLEIPLWYTAGAVISGAQMGDKMSPLSDTTLLAAASAETSVFEHVVSMFYTTVPAALLCVIVYFFLGIHNTGSLTGSEISTISSGIAANFNLNVLVLLPLILVLGLSIKQVPAFITFCAGIICAVIFAVVFQGESLSNVLGYAMNGYSVSTGISSLDGLLSRGGIAGMLEMVGMVLMCGMLSGLLGKMNIMNPIVEAITKKVHTANGIVIATLVTAGILAIPGGQYPPLTIPAIAFKSTYEKEDIHPAVLSRSMEDLGTLLCAVLPYGISAAYYSATLGVAPMQYIPFTLLPILSPLIAFINAWFGIGLFRRSDKIIYRPLWRRSRA